MEDPGRGRRLTAAAVIAALAVAGCGGGTGGAPDSAQVRAVVLTYARAFGSGNGKKACDQLTKEGQAAFVKLVAVLANTHDCATGMRQAQQAVGPQAASAIAGARVSSIHLSGSHATATLTAGAEGAVVRLVKGDGGWKLVAAPGLSR